MTKLEILSIVGLALLFFVIAVHGQETGQISDNELIAENPKCDPAGFWYGWCKWINEDVPLGFIKIKGVIGIPGSVEERINKLQEIIVERQREHFLILYRARAGELETSVGEMQKQLIQDIQDKIRETREVFDKEIKPPFNYTGNPARPEGGVICIQGGELPACESNTAPVWNQNACKFVCV